MLEVSKFNEKAIWLCIILFLCGYPILISTGLKLHYFFFIFVCLFLLILNFNTSLITTKLLYFATLCFSTFHFLLTQPINVSFVFSILTYFVIPVIFFSRAFESFNIEVFKRPFQIFTIIYFIGLLLQSVGFESIFLETELTYTNGELHDRFGSFAGGSLGVGFTASISFIYTFFDWLYHKKRDLFTLSVLVISLLALIMAQSRRFYFFVFIIILAMIFLNSKKEFNVKKVITTAIISILLLIITISALFYFKGSNYYVDRFLSTFDFKYDASNALRIIMWINAFNNFLHHFWFGVGLGDMTSVGKDVWENISSVDELKVAESYFLKNFVEGGIFFGSFFLIFCSKYFYRSIKSFHSFSDNNKKIATFLFSFFFLDSFISTSLESVISSVIFWICISIFQTKKEQTHSNT